MRCYAITSTHIARPVSLEARTAGQGPAGFTVDNAKAAPEGGQMGAERCRVAQLGGKLESRGRSG